MNRIIECIPNISEGRDRQKIDAIVAEVEKVKGVMLLDVDPGASTNRTVITFAGEPKAVQEAAFLLIKKASELIDMTTHKGEHPRQGATDVCPFVPIAGVSMEECVEIARGLGKRVGEELGIAGYYYESAALSPERRNLAVCRKGEYEALDKITTAEGKPDFGPSEVTTTLKKAGLTTIGARNFLVAYNVNLNTTSTRRANAIAFDIREAGRTLREGDTISGKPVDTKRAMASGALDVWGGTTFMLASQSGKLVVISVIAALYPAITVLLARIFLKERLERHQVIGLYGAGIAIVLLTIS